MASNHTYASKVYDTDVQAVVEHNRAIFEPDSDAISVAFEVLKSNQGNTFNSHDSINGQENAEPQD